jgi:hypothetical protein
MHRIVLVTLNKNEAQTSAAARQAVLDYLDEQGFADNEGRFHDGWCDSFEIGGRFTGYLDDPEGSPDKRKCEPDLVNDDDAQVVTAGLYERHLRQFEWESEVYRLKAEYGDDDPEIGFLDTDGDEVGPDFIGNKWLVVLDTHE